MDAQNTILILSGVDYLAMHYAQRYQNRIRFLEQKIRDYYSAIYCAKQSAGYDPGVCAAKVLEGSEEGPILREAEDLRKVIEDLPLWDCGC